MASSSGNGPAGDDRQSGTTPDAPSHSDTPAASPAVEKFLSCRWRRPAETGGVDCCGHRDVLPMAGTAGFQAEAWCTECALYKAKRVPRKREDPRPASVDDYWRR